MKITQIQQTIENQVIAGLNQLDADVRASFQDRVRTLATSAPQEQNEEVAWTGFVARACSAELRRKGLARDQRANLRRLLENARLWLQLAA